MPSSSARKKDMASSHPEDGSLDVFVQISAGEGAVTSTLHEGQRVSFDVVTDQRRGKSNAQNLKAV